MEKITALMMDLWNASVNNVVDLLNRYRVMIILSTGYQRISTRAARSEHSRGDSVKSIVPTCTRPTARTDMACVLVFDIGSEIGTIAS